MALFQTPPPSSKSRKRATESSPTSELYKEHKEYLDSLAADNQGLRNFIDKLQTIGVDFDNGGQDEDSGTVNSEFVKGQSNSKGKGRNNR